MIQFLLLPVILFMMLLVIEIPTFSKMRILSQQRLDMYALELLRFKDRQVLSDQCLAMGLSCTPSATEPSLLRVVLEKPYQLIFSFSNAMLKGVLNKQESIVRNKSYPTFLKIDYVTLNSSLEFCYSAEFDNMKSLVESFTRQFSSFSTQQFLALDSEQVFGDRSFCQDLIREYSSGEVELPNYRWSNIIDRLGLELESAELFDMQNIIMFAYSNVDLLQQDLLDLNFALYNMRDYLISRGVQVKLYLYFIVPASLQHYQENFKILAAHPAEPLYFNIQVVSEPALVKDKLASVASAMLFEKVVVQ